MLPFNILNSFLYGTPTADEIKQVLRSVIVDPGVAQYLKDGIKAEGHAKEMNDKSNQEMVNHRVRQMEKEQFLYSEFLPMTSLAAADADNMCDLRCEAFILNKYGLGESLDAIREKAVKMSAFGGKGVSIYNIGKILQSAGDVFVSRRFRQDIPCMKEMLGKEYDVIAVVNENKLTDGEVSEFENLANHAVVVLEVGEDTIRLYNPATGNRNDEYPLEVFCRAWSDSRCFMACAKKLETLDDYEPCPIDVSDIELDPELEEITEAISETAHEIWSQDRKREGWKYGPVRKQVTLDDGTKDWQNPDLIPYNMLPDLEKEYDRKMAMNTIRLVELLGFRIINLNAQHRCPDCGGMIEPQDQYCRHCGRVLMNEDFE